MMNSILTKALMKYHNDFFTMTYAEQETWKLEEHDDIDKKIRAFVDNALGVTDEDEYDDEKNYEYNVVMLEYFGIGQFHFMLNDFNWDAETVSYKNFWDYNVYYHEWQENALSEDENFTGYEKKALYNRWSSWARALVDGKFNYLNLDSLQIWITWALEDVSFDWIEERVPHNYVPGKNDGKKVEGGYLWDKNLDAKGLEGWFEQLNDFSRDWIAAKHDEMDELGDVVFQVRKDGKLYDPTIDYVFGSMNVLKDLTFVNFIDDAEKLKGDNGILFEYHDKVIEEFKTAMTEKFEEVKQTPPNVMKLKKKRNVVVADGVLDDLEDVDE